MTQPAKFDINSAKRIVKATQWVEQQPRSSPGTRRDGPPIRQPFWAKLLDINTRQFPDDGTADVIAPVLVYDPLKGPFYYSWIGMNITPAGLTRNPNVRGTASALCLNPDPDGVGVGCIVRLIYTGDSRDGTALYAFSEGRPSQDQNFLPPHDHRSNEPAYGGFSFSCYHPGTSVPQMPWAI